jgi:predicted GTPase
MWTVRRLNQFYDQEIMIQYGKNLKTIEKAINRAIKLQNAVVFHWNKPVAIIRNGKQTQ